MTEIKEPKPLSLVKRKKLFEKLQAENPNPTTELNFTSPFELLIAVILSAQATDVGVNKATDILFKYASTPEAIFALGEEKLKDYIKTIGLFNSKAKHIIKACEMLINNHNSQVPETRPELEALPGVGRKTANVVLNTAFNQLTMAVDTHIFRVSNRTGLAPGKNVREVEDELLKRIPKAYLKDAHHWLILHGRYICQARKPKCSACVIYDCCNYIDKQQ